MKLTKKLIFTAIISLGITGCGGGGDGSTANNPTIKVPSTQSFNVQAALLNFLNDQNSYRVTGERVEFYITGNITEQLNGTLTNSPVSQSLYGTDTRKIQLNQKTTFLTLNGITTSNTYWYDEIPFIYSLKINADQPRTLCDTKGVSKFLWDQNPCTIEKTQPLKPPSASFIGGQVDWLSIGKPDYSLSRPFAGKFSWQLEPDTASTALLKIIYTEEFAGIFLAL
jgi:hypothetical protein